MPEASLQLWSGSSVDSVVPEILFPYSRYSMFHYAVTLHQALPDRLSLPEASILHWLAGSLLERSPRFHDMNKFTMAYCMLCYSGSVKQSVHPLEFWFVRPREHSVLHYLVGFTSSFHDLKANLQL